MVRVLPHGLGHYDRGVQVDTCKDIETHALAGDEAVSADGVNRMPTQHLDTLPGEGVFEEGLQRQLRRPTDLVRIRPQIAAGNEHDLVGLKRRRPLLARRRRFENAH
jgi:hypothetical protein